MKQIIKSGLCLFIVSVFIHVKSFSQTVYVQENGKKYHMKNCSVAGTGKKGMTVAEAKKGGYTSCKVCKPDENIAAEAKKAASATPATPAEKPKK
jgi:hypothetical protein